MTSPGRFLGPGLFVFLGAVLLATAALGIDAVMVCSAKVATLRAARSGALAGAGALAAGERDAAAAAAVARAFGGRPQAGGSVIVVGENDVDVDTRREVVAVFARRAGAMPTLLAHLFAGQPLEVRASARAVVAEGASATCLRPWMLPDGFEDLSPSDGAFGPGDLYEPGLTSWGTDLRDAGRDRGRLIALRPDGGDVLVVTPGTFHAIALDDRAGRVDEEGAYARDIARCSEREVAVGQKVRVLRGAFAATTLAGMRRLIALDPGARWDDARDGIVGSSWPAGASPRIVRVAFFDPREARRDGGPPAVLTVVNIGALFLGESPVGSFHGRLMPAPGLAPGRGSSRATAPLTRAARLVP